MTLPAGWARSRSLRMLAAFIAGDVDMEGAIKAD
jgi:hypothetical protein